MTVFDATDAIAKAGRNPTRGPATGFAENFSASFDAFAESQQFISKQANTVEETQRVLNALKERGVANNKLPNPPGTQTSAAGIVSGEAPDMDTQVDRFFEQVRQIGEENPDALRGLPTSRGELNRVIADEAIEAQETAEDVAFRSTTLGQIGQFAGQAAGAVTDPPVLASMFLGAPASAGILRTAATEAAVGTAAEIPIQVGVQKSRGELGLESSFQRGAQNVLAAGVGGGVLGGAVAGASRGVSAVKQAAQRRAAVAAVRRQTERNAEDVERQFREARRQQQQERQELDEVIRRSREQRQEQTVVPENLFEAAERLKREQNRPAFSDVVIRDTEQGNLFVQPRQAQAPGVRDEDIPPSIDEGKVSGLFGRRTDEDLELADGTQITRAFETSRSGLAEDLQGQGFGVQMYEALAQRAREEGSTLVSDVSRTDAAERVWESLRRRGYPVEKVEIDDGNLWALHPTQPLPDRRPGIDQDPALKGAANTMQRIGEIERNNVFEDTPQVAAEFHAAVDTMMRTVQETGEFPHVKTDLPLRDDVAERTEIIEDVMTDPSNAALRAIGRDAGQTMEAGSALARFLRKQAAEEGTEPSIRTAALQEPAATGRQLRDIQARQQETEQILDDIETQTERLRQFAQDDMNGNMTIHTVDEEGNEVVTDVKNLLKDVEEDERALRALEDCIGGTRSQ